MPTNYSLKESYKDTISVKDASQSTGYSTSYISRLCRSNKISCEYENSEWLIRTQSLREFVSNQTMNKKAHAARLASSRKNTYHIVQTEKKLKLLLSSERYVRAITPQSVWHKIAFAGVSLIVVFSSSSLVLLKGTSTFLRIGNATLQESLQGFDEIVTGAAHVASQQIAAAAIGNEAYRTNEQSVHVQAPTLSTQMRYNFTALKIVLPAAAALAHMPFFSAVAQK